MNYKNNRIKKPITKLIIIGLIYRLKCSVKNLLLTYSTFNYIIRQIAIVVLFYYYFCSSVYFICHTLLLFCYINLVYLFYFL